MEFSEVIKRRKMVRAFTSEALAAGTTERLLRAACRAPSAGFSQGYSFLVLEGEEQAAPLWEIFCEDAPLAGAREAAERAEIAALSRAPLVIVPLASKDVYLDRYVQPDKGWTDRDESRWPVPYWYIDTGFAALLILLAVVDEELGAVFFGIPPSTMAAFRTRFGVPEQWTRPARSRRRGRANRRCGRSQRLHHRARTRSHGNPGRRRLPALNGI